LIWEDVTAFTRKEHEGVVEAAELGALPTEGAGAGDVEVELIGHAAQGVAAEVKAGTVEPWMDVGRAQVDPDRLAGREHHLGVLGLDPEHLHVVGRVLELPPPLEGGDVHGHRVAGGDGVHLVLGDER